MVEMNFVQSDLRFLLPIQAGQQVAIFGHAPELVDAIATAGITPINVLPGDCADKNDNGRAHVYHAATAYQQPLPLVSASVDHVLMPVLVDQQPEWIIGEVARVLKPGGWFFLGISNAQGWQRLCLWLGRWKEQSKTQPSSSIRAYRRLLKKKRLNVLNCYGVYTDLKHPRYLVPLEIPGAAHHFFEQIIVPYSWQAAVGQRLAVFLTQIGRQQLLFKDFGFVAQRI